ncbi:hypothetical protein [Ktedonospora formicarum]|uniref:Uncharacterized protein n=1 Tax=Ktedonospora formicarum TaxID=2778364 RepID=A0A8J3HXJ9_9CHLR|nr:hypothetical protein [Ktedonospora formicarum]GHO42408.1 hypothetical protein KSX_05710 [Ktedonospora formicarum]
MVDHHNQNPERSILHLPLPDGRTLSLTAEQALAFLSWFQHYSETLPQALDAWLNDPSNTLDVDISDEVEASIPDTPIFEDEDEEEILQPYVLAQRIGDAFFIVDSGLAIPPNNLEEELDN